MCFSVVNKKNYVGVGVYIGRPSILGNPFKVGKDSSREEVIVKYRSWLWSEIKKRGAIFEELLKLLALEVKYGDLKLICWCKPLSCHGDVIVSALSWLKKQGTLVRVSN